MVPNRSLDRRGGDLDHLATSTIPRKVARSLAGPAARGGARNDYVQCHFLLEFCARKYPIASS